MNRELKNLLLRIVLSVILFILSFFLNNYYRFICLFFSYIITGSTIIKKAFENIKDKQIFDENLLMLIATIGAVIIGEYNEAIFVVLFFQIGEFFQDYAVNKSKNSITSLMNIRPDFARLKKDNNFTIVDPKDVEIGSIIEVRPGEKIPLDGFVIKGSSVLNMSSLTGESIPCNVYENDEVLNGSINLNSVIQIRTTKEFYSSTVNKILNLVENASTFKSKSENFITKFANYYTPIVVIIALIMAMIFPLITKSEFTTWFYRAITFLVISCPCALVISVPLSFFCGIGLASKNGILIKGSNYLESLTKVKTVVFDKTGTLTNGTFSVTKIQSNLISNDELLRIAYHMEYYSSHPIAVSIKKAYNGDFELENVSNVKEFFGKGVSGEFCNDKIIIGNLRFMNENNIKVPEVNEVGTVIYVIKNNSYLGYILIQDEIKLEAKSTIEELKDIGVKKVIMLTGDKKSIASSISNELGLDNFYYELLPNEKIDKVKLLSSEKKSTEKILFVGDGINDVPVLIYSDIGIAMGGIGTDAAIEASDVVIMNDNIHKIVDVIKIAKKTLLVVKENIIFAIGIKFLILFLGIINISSIWFAIFADVGVSVITIINAIRIAKHKYL